ncbi:hypothetical protein PsorP6_000589 [Peronosclerospora sorghi]|uniref:Uncharacterized protein n=1 Tax=Peronosclerospora sorghi TaxID=230839 RepID=A0ACC0WU28_9STRA|nr:hypothetical protein PsorP6_000589 [Peronosclerospora sorghi]
MTTEKRRQSIEVFRLRLRETVNEGDDGESSSSPNNTPEDGGVGQRELVVPLSSPNENGSDEKGGAEKETEHGRPDERDCSRGGMKVGIEDDREREQVASKFVHGERHEKQCCKRLLFTSSSCGDNCSSRTISCSLDAADLSSPLSIDELSSVPADSDPMMESLEENKVVTRDEAEPGEATRGRSGSRSHSSSVALAKQEMGQSRRVVLVTRPSQRDLELWSERATSTMTKSTSRLARSPSSAQSRKWVLEYKPLVRHSGWLIKRESGLRTFKRRLFCIVDHELIYHDSHDATEVRGRLDLTKKSSVQCLLHSGFKFVQGGTSMVLYALDNHDRDVWMKKLQEHNVHVVPEGAKTAKLLKQQSSGQADKGEPILFSGWLRKRGRMVKSTKRRWFELSSGTLSYYAHPQGGSRKGTIDISHARVSPVDTFKTGENYSFQISTPHRSLFLHADSQEERSIWLATLASVSHGSSPTRSAGGATSPSTEIDDAARPPIRASCISRLCKCGALEEAGVAIDGVCRRCMSSFISNTEDVMVDVAREVQLLLASPYSPEGCTSAAFLKEHTGRAVSNATVRQFMNGLSDYVLHTRLKELQMLAGITEPRGPSESDSDDDGMHKNGKNVLASAPDATAVSDITTTIESIIYEQIEERVFYPLYRAILANVHEQTREDAKVLKGKIDVLRSKSQAFFGISPDSVSPSKWSAACAKLREVDKVSLPYMKRAQLLAACKEIYATYHTEHPTQPPMSADAFIPAFIYVLIHSHLRDPVALKELITFFDSGKLHGEIAYFVTCLEIALEYIRSLLTACTVVLSSRRKLGIEFSRHAEADVVIVHRLLAGEQAQQSGTIHVGDVLVAVNGLPVYEMELADVAKLWRGVDGEAELCFLPMDEYLSKYGAAS